MSAKQIRNIAKVLLLLYIGYFGCVSYFVHSHVYNGVVYIHSHPYNKLANDTGESKQLPFETHHHTAAGFFTFNQISNLASFEAQINTIVNDVYRTSQITIDTPFLLKNAFSPVIFYFNHRAPPFYSVA